MCASVMLLLNQGVLHVTYLPCAWSSLPPLGYINQAQYKEERALLIQIKQDDRIQRLR